MTFKQELLLQLKEDFKLNIYEVKIWTVLLEKGIATAGELADLSGVPRSRCYDVLESLEKKGFIIMKIGKPIKYISVEPEEIISRVKKNIEEDTHISIKMFDEIRTTDVFKDLELLYNTGIDKVDGQELSTSIIGRENINHFIKTLMARAEKSIVITTTEDGCQRKLTMINKLLKKSNKNVSIKLVAPHDSKLAKKYKGKISLVNRETNSRIVIIDSKEFLFMINDGKTDKQHDCGVWVSSSFLAEGISDILNTVIK